MALLLVQTCPLSHQIGSERPFMTRTRNIVGKTSQCVAHATQFKTQLPTFSEIVIDLGLEISTCVHVVLPGQGKATAASFELSSLA